MTLALPPSRPLASSILVNGSTTTPSPSATPTKRGTPSGGGLFDGISKGDLSLLLPSATPSGVTNPSWSLVFTYDAVGNRLSQNANGTLTYYAYNQLDQLTCSDANQTAVNNVNCPGQTAYGYDGRGNLTSITGGTTYSWDARDRMTGATVPGGSATFAYDDMDHRTQQVASNVTPLVINLPEQRQANRLTG